MARLRQKGAASGGPQAPQALWERAGARTGKGAEALFDRLDAQNAQSAQSVRDAAQAALTLERLAAQIRAGAWSAEIAAVVAAARAALDQP